ncbi:aminotransferase class V-fold PLP-dependent enzyme [Paludisphaera mucosa]|uniref:Cysteine desulfurase n=1 Tax=Paludisphaera mucosa TaxID=3030827 RepID=A0ABT6F482_9BACT|nr:SufS family cysteine desulfurase [Paludisphaera mucosa]MDG3002364.1 SufS family cysteine desulfurase [Paludisphaera mucosa]
MADAVATGRDLELDVERVRADFPPLGEEVRPGVPLRYFDSAATALKPRSVIEAVRACMAEYPANVHRGLHVLSERATEAFENARIKVARHLGVDDPAQVIFTRGTTEAINLAARSWGRHAFRPGDAIVLSELEHHANIVPWQMIARETGAELRYVELTDDLEYDLDSFDRLFDDGRVRMVATTGMSNVTGIRPPVEEIARRARERGARVLIDAAQSLAHERLDVVALDVDFAAFSAHKVFGPTGVGVLYGKREHLEAMEPVLGGGNMVLRVERETAVWNELPDKFEAGTPPIAEVIGLGAAIDYLEALDAEAVARHERALIDHAHEVLGAVEGLRILGPAATAGKGPIVGFTLDGTHPHDLSHLLDRSGIAIRAGHHCAMPLHTRLGIPASARASFALYNTADEIDQLAAALGSIKSLLRRR